MTALSANFLRRAHENAKHAASRIQLELENVFREGTAGDFLGKETGSSLDLHDHRSYYPGDDPRHIDWRVYARTESYVIRLFREEIAPRVDLVLDLSPSMLLGEEKALRSLELLYFVIESALEAQASLRCYLLDGTGAHAEQLEAFIHYGLPEPRRGSVTPAAAARMLELRPASLRVFISDLLFPDSPHELLLRLCGQNSRTLLFVPFAPSEEAPDWNGAMELSDCETGARREQTIDDSILERYRQAYRTHFESWRQSCRKLRVPCVRVRAGGDLAPALQKESLIQRAARVWA